MKISYPLKKKRAEKDFENQVLESQLLVLIKVVKIYVLLSMVNYGFTR